MVFFLSNSSKWFDKAEWLKNGLLLIFIGYYCSFNRFITSQLVFYLFFSNILTLGSFKKAHICAKGVWSLMHG